MKQAINFRLSKHSITVLSLLAESLELSKTAVMEKALQQYFERESAVRHSPLMEFAGILSDNDANDMLETIYHNRMNSDREIDL